MPALEVRAQELARRADALRGYARVPVEYLFTLQELARRQSIRGDYRQACVPLYPPALIAQRYDECFEILERFRTRELELRQQYFLRHGCLLPMPQLMDQLDDFPPQRLFEYKDFDSRLPVLTPGWLKWLGDVLNDS